MSVSQIGILLLFLFSLSGCEKSMSVNALKRQLHEAKCDLIHELEMIESISEFEEHETRLSTLFEEIAECMIQTDRLSKENSQNVVEHEDAALSERLYAQCIRILALPGGESWLLKCQAQAVRLLDKESCRRREKLHGCCHL